MADNSLFGNIYTPDVLTCIANLSNDEVFTPPSVANAMLDMLPQELFENPDTTFLDPACKSGVFLREIAVRLIKGLEWQFPDLQDRLDHIFHHQLYGIAITELTSLLSRRTVYCSKYPNSAYSVSMFDDAQGNIRYTERDAETRVAEQMHTSAVPYRIILQASAMRTDGTSFTDHDIHRYMRRRGFKQLNAGEDKNEWYKCTVNDVKAAIVAVRNRTENDENRTLSFPMRPEQAYAVKSTMAYYEKAQKSDPTRAPKFLWNCKMRFGKTFATYQLAKRMGLKRVLVLTFKPAVESAWADDLMSHIDFEGWQFISNKDAHNRSVNINDAFEAADKSRPIVVFGSFQDLLGTNSSGGIKVKNEFIHANNWDLIAFDEYHFGAWRENAKKLFENPDEEAEADFDQERYKRDQSDKSINETLFPIPTSYYLYFSGTPFRAINSG